MQIERERESDKKKTAQPKRYYLISSISRILFNSLYCDFLYYRVNVAESRIWNTCKCQVTL